MPYMSRSKCMVFCPCRIKSVCTSQPNKDIFCSTIALVAVDSHMNSKGLAIGDKRKSCQPVNQNLSNELNRNIIELTLRFIHETGRFD